MILAIAALGCGEHAPEHTVIPIPTTVELSSADTFHLSGDTRITFDPGDADAERIGRFLANLIGNTVETTPPVVETGHLDRGPSIHLSTRGSESSLGGEGYELFITDSAVNVSGATPAGLFYGVQTVRQLLPAVIEYTAAYPRPLYLPAGRVIDAPRFEWRGAMLDVTRHFLPMDDVKRFIDLMALYKLNRLHIHLSDDQGWRIEIPGWPNLTEYGGSTEVGGGPSGYYTAQDYRELVRYAEERFVMVVPEIDVPGHTNAALASYPELNCDGVAPDLYTGTEVGFSSLCTDKEITYEFLDDVIREISALTPGPYFHIGGDEARETKHEDFVAFIERVQGIVQSHGKRMIGWDEVATTEVAPESLIQLWRPLWPEEGAPELEGDAAKAAAALQAGATRAVRSGAKFILSPADRIYLDMKYDSTTVLGLDWAGMSNVQEAYDWELTQAFKDIPEGSIAGVEAPLWSETLGTLDDLEHMAFPRLAGVAEVAWSRADSRAWDEFRLRLGAHGARWTALGVNFQRSELIPWTLDPR